MTKHLLYVIFYCLLVGGSAHASAQKHELSNGTIVASFGPSGLVSILDGVSGSASHAVEDSWSIAMDNAVLKSGDSRPSIRADRDRIVYDFKDKGYEIEVVYQLAFG